MGLETLKNLNFRTKSNFLSTFLSYSCAMACEGPSLIKLSLLFLNVSEGLRVVVFFLCLLAFVCPPPKPV